MSIYVVAPKSGLVKARYEKSPRVVLATTARDEASLPAEIRTAADVVRADPGGMWRRGAVPGEADGLIVWHEGERLTHGAGAEIRRDLMQPGWRYWAPVHLPCIRELDVDLISLQPRWFSVGATADRIRPDIRIAASPAASAAYRRALEKLREPWAVLFLALLEEQNKPKAALPPLAQLWQQGGMEPVLQTLVLRNLIVLLLRHQDYAQADHLLELGMTAYAGYAELWYLSAVSAILQGKPSQAVPHLEQAMKKRDDALVGSGGESFHRARWLLASISVLAGREEVAFDYLCPTLHVRPAFRPAVEALLELRVSSERAYSLQWPLGELARREPEYLEPVVRYMIRHGQDAVAERLAGVMGWTVPAPVVSAGGRAGVVLYGPILTQSSLARVNRCVSLALMETDDLDVGLEPQGFAAIRPADLAGGDRLDQALRHRPGRVDLTVRHLWPPDFRRPASGRLACILPWEYSVVPERWVEAIERNVDELWVPSRFVRDAFVGGGIADGRVHVLPLGVDPEVFQPEGATLRPSGCRRFVFLFVGGLIARKGVDLLLEAYGEAFSKDDDVTLVLKEMGAQSFYGHNSLHQRVNHWRNRSTPHLVVLSNDLPDADLAALYRGADAFVLPYRGEGFGLPLAEAQACGTPVITTGAGPAREFCAADSTYFIPAESVEVPDAPPSLGALTGPLTWLEPDVGALARILRHVYEHPDEAKQRGGRAAAQIRLTHDWRRVTPAFVARARGLASGFPS